MSIYATRRFNDLNFFFLSVFIGLQSTGLVNASLWLASLVTRHNPFGGYESHDPLMAKWRVGAVKVFYFWPKAL